MAGLNLRNKYTLVKALESKKEGIFFANNCNKWLVRIKIKSNISTLGGFDTEDEAKVFFDLKKTELSQTK